MRCEARSLRKDWPTLSVVFDAAVEDGRSLAILGPSGCGKSTVLPHPEGPSKIGRAHV